MIDILTIGELEDRERKEVYQGEKDFKDVHVDGWEPPTEGNDPPGRHDGGKKSLKSARLRGGGGYGGWAFETIPSSPSPCDGE